jgi:pyruvate,orthophosphate dikinase
MLHRDGDAVDAARLGGKAVGLLEAAAAAVPVPPFFVLTTDVAKESAAEIDRAVDAGLASLPTDRPLVFSVRSSPVASMPGMLDTVLDVGATRDALPALEAFLGDAAAALDVRRRFLESWGTTVLGMPRTAFDALARARVASRSTMPPPALAASELEARVARHEAAIGRKEPRDLRAQIREAVLAVLRSWESPRARDWRAANPRSPEGMGVVVQLMVFGNAPSPSGAGVAFTRNPVSGEKQLFGEWLPNAQGDEVTSGRASPAGLTAASSGRREGESLERQAPDAFSRLSSLATELERRRRDALDLELTLERGKLWVLQVRTAKRAPRAAVRIAVDLVKEGLADPDTVLSRLEPSVLSSLVERTIADPPEPLTAGLAASPGAVSGRVVLEVDEAVRAAAAGEAVILVRTACTPEDAPGIRAAAGILTTSGGLTSHAAVIARALAKPCIVSASDLHVDRGRAEVRSAGRSVVPLPTALTLDGSTGRVFAGALPLRSTWTLGEAREIAAWARERGTWSDVLARLPT